MHREEEEAAMAAAAAFPALSLTLIVSCVFRITGEGGRRIRSSAGSEDGLAAPMYYIRKLRVVLMLFALVTGFETSCTCPKKSFKSIYYFGYFV